MRQRPRQQPYALLITTKTAHLKQRRVLSAVGFKALATCSLLSGYMQARRLLSTREPAQPVLVLVDVFATEPGFPEVSGMLLATVLARQMRLGEIRPAWLVGLAADPTPEQTAEALAVGCERVVHVPLKKEALPLRELTTAPAPIPHLSTPPEAARLIHLCQNMAQRMLEAVQSAQIITWTPEDAALLLRWLTPYPLARGTQPQISADEVVRVERLFRALGSQQAARQQLETIVAHWQTRYPLHSEILRRFLQGCERREIVRYFVEQRLYEDSRVYDCIKELPQRICDHLRRQQALQADGPGAE